MRKILLVEDNLEKATALVEKLTTREYWVDHCDDSVKALGRLAGCHGYDCIVASYEMPHPNGIGLVKRIRMFDKKVGVIIVTDEPDRAEKETGDLDVMAVVSRCDDNSHLLEMIGQAMEMTEMPDEKRAALETDLHTQTIHLKNLPPALDAP